MSRAVRLRDEGHEQRVSYLRKVFILLTELRRDVCHYCTFAMVPRTIAAPFLNPHQVLDIVRRCQAAEELNIPFASSILIGISETRAERIENLLALREFHAECGDIQEVIIEIFRAEPGTKMAEAPESDMADLQWNVAVAWIIFGPDMSIQAAPNLSGGGNGLIAAAIND